MARSILTIRNGLINSLVSVAAAIGITIDPNNWIFVPGDISQTDQKLLLLNTVATGQGFEEQINDAALANIEEQVKNAPPQTAPWFQYQALLFQWNNSDPQIPQIQSSTSITPLAIIWNPVIPSYRVISFCSALYGSAGRCLIKVAAANSNGLPSDLDSTVGAGALAAFQSTVNMVGGPGISYVVSSGKSDWLFLQIDLYFNGLYASVIFNNVSNAITKFLNNISFDGIFKLSLLEEAILAVPGVQDMIFINVAARPDYNSLTAGTTSTFGSLLQQYLVSSSTENQKSWSTVAGYIRVEDGTSTGTPSPVPNSKLSDFRVGSSGVLNLNCIAV